MYTLEVPNVSDLVYRRTLPGWQRSCWWRTGCSATPASSSWAAGRRATHLVRAFASLPGPHVSGMPALPSEAAEKISLKTSGSRPQGSSSETSSCRRAGSMRLSRCACFQKRGAARKTVGFVNECWAEVNDTPDLPARSGRGRRVSGYRIQALGRRQRWASKRGTHHLNIHPLVGAEVRTLFLYLPGEWSGSSDTAGGGGSAGGGSPGGIR